MNVFEVALLFAALVGLITGGSGGKPWGVLGVIVGALVGLLIGLVCFFLTLALSMTIAKVGHSLDDPPKNRLLHALWWIGSFSAVAVMPLAPITTIALLRWVAGQIGT